MTTMRIPAAFSAARERPPSSWLPAGRVSVAPESESVAVCASPLSAACTLWPAAPRLRVNSEMAASRPCAEAFGGAGGAALVSDEFRGGAASAVEDGAAELAAVKTLGSNGGGGALCVEALTE